MQLLGFDQVESVHADGSTRGELDHPNSGVPRATTRDAYLLSLLLTLLLIPQPGGGD